MPNNKHAVAKKLWNQCLSRMQTLVLVVLGGMMVAVAVSAQSTEAANTKTGSILGTVVDTSGDPIAGANVARQGPAAAASRLSQRMMEPLHSTTSHQELPFRSPSLRKDLRSGVRPWRSSPGRRRL